MAKKTIKPSPELLKALANLPSSRKKEEQTSGYFPPILTLDEFIAQLQNIREEMGHGKMGVSACIPEGIFWKYEHVVNAHYANGIVNIPVTQDYKVAGR